MKEKKSARNAQSVLIAGVMVNLVLGVLYAWSVVQKELVYGWGWSHSAASMPYSVALASFTVTLLVAGRLQDRIGPERIIIVGVLMTGLGMIVSGFAIHPVTLVITFGVICGAGIGVGYSCVAPSVMKWFPAHRKGTVTGIVVGGFGVASIYIAPLMSVLIDRFGLSGGLMLFGLFILLWGIPPALRFSNPPEGYVPLELHSQTSACSESSPCFRWRTMLKMPGFYQLWLMFILSSFSGLFIIGSIGSIGLEQSDFTNGALLVGTLSLFNSIGRVGGGMLSDRLGRMNTMRLALLLHGINVLAFTQYRTAFLLFPGTALAGLFYGALLSLFMAMTADRFGVRNFGMNYGLVNTGWGLAGLLGPVLAGRMFDLTGTFGPVFAISAGLLGLTLLLSYVPVLEKKDWQSTTTT